MPDPLSALLMTSDVSVASSFSERCSSLDMFGYIFAGCNISISFFILSRYASIAVEARGGCHVLLGLNG